MRLSCLFVLQTGIRVGELVGLQWSDIDFENRVLRIYTDFRLNSNHFSYMRKMVRRFMLALYRFLYMSPRLSIFSISINRIESSMVYKILQSPTRKR